MAENIETILKNKVKELGEYLISICENDNKKDDIKNALIDLPTYKILLFVSFLDKNKIDNQINDFIKLFSISNTNETRENIKSYIDYFIQVRNILHDN
jgi:hypothetical protein